MGPCANYVSTHLPTPDPIYFLYNSAIRRLKVFQVWHHSKPDCHLVIYWPRRPSPKYSFWLSCQYASGIIEKVLRWIRHGSAIKRLARMSFDGGPTCLAYWERPHHTSGSGAACVTQTRDLIIGTNGVGIWTGGWIAASRQRGYVFGSSQVGPSTRSHTEACLWVAASDTFACCICYCPDGRYGRLSSALIP